ncbi:hypothetical protein M9H77_32485 [Catharanthus roseus]|uniref:Uncharacterized protein n=1 Tax=Catharanthus roseus TaxID=4058 RepID=A0ACC0A7A5_CATRO|nr:hypothetical protein M9H77_32485 [Catharanthus roseus]
MAMAAQKMEIISEELIRPSSPTPQTLTTHKFSYLDQVQLTCHFPIILFYPNHHQLDSSNLHGHTQIKSQNLKQSLSKVLTQFYPLAGRININSSVDCNDSGVTFLESRVQSQLSEAIKNIPIDELKQYLPSLKNDIPLAVKMSFFECGGTAIGIYISHKIADAMSLATFLNSWTATTRSEEETDTDLQPNFDLGSHHFPPLENIAETKLLPDNENIVMKRFVFNKEKLQALKAQLIASSAMAASRLQIVVAFIWKQFIDMTCAKFDAKNKFVAAQVVNLRSRMNPPLPRSTMGNILTVALAHAIVKEKNKDFADLVEPLIVSLEKIDDKYAKDLQKGTTNYMDNEGSGSESEPQEEEELLVFSSWCRLGFYDLEFGFGKPVSVCTTSFTKKNLICLMDTRSGDGIEAWINMVEDEMAMFPSEFLSLVDHDFSK